MLRRRSGVRRGASRCPRLQIRQCHRSLQNQPLGGESKPATLR
jgi:hypothetical protein